MKGIVLNLLLFASVYASAQTIRGKVLSSDLAPIGNASVVMQSPDSVFIAATCTDDSGVFELASELTAFRLIVQHLTYGTHESIYSNSDNITIKLNEKTNSIGEVVVKADRPIMKLVDGKISYDMPLLLHGKVVSSTYDALLQLPGVREQGGSLVLAGATGVTILINGQITSMPPASLLAALKMLPYDQVQSAEIMYSTPPQYHIKGAAINIILKGDSTEEGLQAQVNTAYTQKFYSNYNAGITLLYSTPKLSADLNYSYNLNHQKTGVDIHSHHLYNGIVYDIEQFNRGDRKSNDHNIRLGLNYKLSQKDKIGLTYSSQITIGVDNNESSNGTYSNSRTHKENDDPIQMHNILLNYISGFGLKAGVEYTMYKDHTSQHFTENKTGVEDNFVSKSKQSINKYRLFADQSNSIGSWTLNYGGQYEFASDNSSQIYSSMAGKDMSDSNMDSKLKEYTSNLYMGFEKMIGEKLSLEGSILGEYYKIGDYDKWTIFPAFTATYSLSPTHIFQFSLSSDKIYPSYWDLHGGVSYLNGYAELHGNPYLIPYKEYSGQLSYILKSKYIITAYCNYMKDFFDQLPYQASDRLALIYQSLNYDYRNMMGLNVIVPFKAGKLLDSRLTLNGFYDKVKYSHFHDISFSNDNFAFYAQLNNTLNLSSKPNIKLEVAGAYITKNIQGPAELSNLFNIDAGIKWTFWHDMGEIRLKGTDLFNSWVPDMTMKYNTQNLRMNMIPDSRTVSLSFTLRLGDTKTSEKKVDTSRFGTK